MNTGHSHPQDNIRVDREAGAQAISAQAQELGQDSGLTLSCVWDLGQDIRLQHAHRLDLSTGTSSVRLYFSDPELATGCNESRKKRTMQRLCSAIAQLLPRTPAKTYATSTN